MPFVVFCLNQERRTDTRSGTKNRLSSESGEPFNGQPGSLVLSYHEPATPAFCFFLQLASWNLQLMLFSANGEPFNGKPGSLVLSYHEPATPNHGHRSKARTPDYIRVWGIEKLHLIVLTLIADRSGRRKALRADL